MHFPSRFDDRIIQLFLQMNIFTLGLISNAKHIYSAAGVIFGHHCVSTDEAQRRIHTIFQARCTE